MELIKQWSYVLDGIPGTRVDIVRNVINLVSVHWAASYLVGIPLKTVASPKGVFTEQEVYDILSLLFTCVFIDVQPEHGWALRASAKQYGDVINSMIEKSLDEAAPLKNSVRGGVECSSYREGANITSFCFSRTRSVNLSELFLILSQACSGPQKKSCATPSYAGLPPPEGPRRSW